MDKNQLAGLVGTAMRSKREDLGISQEAFADRIGMHRAYYGHIERGEKNITLQTMIRICRGLDVLPSELLRGMGQ